MSIFSKVLAFVGGLFTNKAIQAVVTPAPGTTVITTTTGPQDVVDTDVQAAIDIVNNVKTALASPVAVLITDLIPVSIVGTIREALVNELPVIAADLAFVKTVLDTSDKSAVMNDILAQIKLSPNADMDAFYHSLAARVLTIVSEGKSPWSVAVMAVEYFFKGLFNPKAVAAPVIVAAPVVAPAAPVAATVDNQTTINQ